MVYDQINGCIVYIMESIEDYLYLDELAQEMHYVLKYYLEDLE